MKVNPYGFQNTIKEAQRRVTAVAAAMGVEANTVTIAEDRRKWQSGGGVRRVRHGTKKKGAIE
jgi:hypothetical protein